MYVLLTKKTNFVTAYNLNNSMFSNIKILDMLPLNLIIDFSCNMTFDFLDISKVTHTSTEWKIIYKINKHISNLQYKFLRKEINYKW